MEMPDNCLETNGYNEKVVKNALYLYDTLFDELRILKTGEETTVSEILYYQSWINSLFENIILELVGESKIDVDNPTFEKISKNDS
ncbi:MAG: hypothetical protein AB9819_00625 [Methanomassiliicoccales archaeon]